jgi:hypothetical protein
MKTATFYELTSKNIVVSGDYFQLARFQSMPFAIGDGEWGASMRHVDCVNVPVHHIRKCTKIEGVYERDGQEAIKTQDHFIAISPELASFLSIPFEERALKAEAAEQKAIQAIHFKDETIRQWWDQPIWKRVWSAIQG